MDARAGAPDKSRATRGSCHESRLTPRVVNVVDRKDSRVVLGMLRAVRGARLFSSRGQPSTLRTQSRGLAGEPLGDAGVYGGSMYWRPTSPSDCARVPSGPVIERPGHHVVEFSAELGSHVKTEKSSDWVAPISTSTDAHHGATRRLVSPLGCTKRGEEQTTATTRTR